MTSVRFLAVPFASRTIRGAFPVPYAPMVIGCELVPFQFAVSCSFHEQPRCSSRLSPGERLAWPAFANVRHAVAGDRPSAASLPAQST